MSGLVVLAALVLGQWSPASGTIPAGLGDSVAACGTTVTLKGGAPPELVSAEDRTLARLRSAAEPAGITVDHAGRFGGRIVVALAVPGGTEVDAVDCSGHVSVVTTHAPRMEGGIAVAPPTFGVYGGKLIGADESSGFLVAVGVDGVSEAFMTSGLPTGAGVGSESLAFVPPGLVAGGGSAYVQSTGGALVANPTRDAGLADGDLLVADTAGETVAIRCAASGVCTREGAVISPAPIRIEGNLLLVATHPGPTPKPLPAGIAGVAQQSGPASVLPYALGILILAALGFLYWRQVRRR